MALVSALAIALALLGLLLVERFGVVVLCGKVWYQWMMKSIHFQKVAAESRALVDEEPKEVN